MITHAAVVWCPRVELGVAITMLDRLQRLACLAITGAIRTTPTAAMEMLFGLVPLDTHIRQVAMNSCYSMRSTDNWRRSGSYMLHTSIHDRLKENIPISSVCGDYMKPHFSFDNKFHVHIPQREDWFDDDRIPVPSNSIAIYTDGSGGSQGLGAGIFFNELSEDLSIPLGHNISVFQAEMYAVRLCVSILKTLNIQDEQIYILFRQ